MMRRIAVLLVIAILSGCLNPPADTRTAREDAEIRVWQSLFEGAWSSEPARHRDEVLRRIRTAVELGGADSMRYLALHLLGRGGTENLRQAEDLLVEASKTLCEAHIDLARLWIDGIGGHSLDGGAGRRHLAAAAARGCPEAHARLAEAMADGRVPVAHPLDDALGEALKGADSECAMCLRVAGDVLSRKQDWSSAIHYWHAAVEAGDLSAAARLGEAYRDGRAPSPRTRQAALGWLMASQLPSEALDGPTAALAAAMPEPEVAEARQWAIEYSQHHLLLAYSDAQLWRGMLAVLGPRDFHCRLSLALVLRPGRAVANRLATILSLRACEAHGRERFL